jgi:hypothetical protein
LDEGLHHETDAFRALLAAPDYQRRLEAFATKSSSQFPPLSGKDTI